MQAKPCPFPPEDKNTAPAPLAFVAYNPALFAPTPIARMPSPAAETATAAATDVAADLYRTAAELYRALPGTSRRVRLLGVAATNLGGSGAEQLALLHPERWGDVERDTGLVGQRPHDVRRAANELGEFRRGGWKTDKVEIDPPQQDVRWSFGDRPQTLANMFRGDKRIQWPA